jgi:cation diffusion facilitator family transporter
VGFLGNELVALYRIREGNAIGSAALVADGYHARTDGFTSLAVVLGSLGVWAGFERADQIAGLAIGVAILAVLRRAAIEVLRRMLNAIDPSLVDRLEREASRVTGVEAVRQVQARWEGHRLHADLAIGVSPTITVVEAHEIAHSVEHLLLHRITHLDHVTVHVEPDGPIAEAAHATIHHHGAVFVVSRIAKRR